MEHIGEDETIHHNRIEKLNDLRDKYLQNNNETNFELETET